VYSCSVLRTGISGRRNYGGKMMVVLPENTHHNKATVEFIWQNVCLQIR